MKRISTRHILSERGSNVAQAAAVALLAAALLGAMLFIVPSFRASVNESFACLVGAIGGGGGGCGGSAQTTTAQSQPPAESEDEDKDDCSGLCQVGGFFKGIGEGVVDTAKGLWTLGSDAVKYAAGDDETREKYAALVDSFQNDPWGTTKAVGEAIVEPMVTDWKEGRYGEAIGRGVFEVVSTIGGPKGLDKVSKLGKVDDIARVAGKADEIADVGRTADKLDELGDVGRVVDDIPCVGAAPASKLPGLAAPLASGCDIDPPAMPNKYDRSKSGYQKPDLDDTNCVYCGQELTDTPRLKNSIEADHLVGLKDAWEMGGKQWTAAEWKQFSNDLDNLVAACKSCNASKQAKRLFEQWAPPNITPANRARLEAQIEAILRKYGLQ